MDAHRVITALGLSLFLTAGGACAREPAPPAALNATATAYCQSGITKSGERTRRGVVAADPRVLPLGSVIRIDAPEGAHDGVYRVLDTGSAVKGRIVDIYMPSCRSAKQFGRRQVVVQVLEWGDRETS